MIQRKKSMHVFAWLVATLLLVSCSEKKEAKGLPPAGKVGTENFVIALLPERNVFEQKKRYKLLAEYLSWALGMNVKTKLLDSYDEIYSEIVNNRVDAAVFGSLSYVVMDSRIPLVPVARPYLVDGRSTYRGMAIVQKEGGITEDVRTWKGKRIALVSKSTTAGYIFPRWYLHKSGIRNFEGHFKKVIFAGSHDSAILAVVKNEADIGCASDDVFNELLEKNQLIRDKVKVVASSPQVPLNVIGIKESTEPELAKRLKEALLAMDKVPEGRDALSALGAARFIETKESEFGPIHEMLGAIGMTPGDLGLGAIGRAARPESSEEAGK